MYAHSSLSLFETSRFLTSALCLTRNFLPNKAVLGGDIYWLYDTFVNLKPGVRMLFALTVWGLILHALYFFQAVIIDFINLFTCTPSPYYRVVLSRVGLVWGRSSKAVHTLPGRSMWEQHRDRTFGIMFPVTNLIGTLFWSLLFPSMKGSLYAFNPYLYPLK